MLAVAQPLTALAVTQAPSGGGGNGSSSNGSKSYACAGIGVAGGQCGTGGDQINHIVRVALNLLSAIVGLVAVIMIIISGLKYVTSGGDSNGIASAKNTLIYAIVGLLVVVMAQTIVHFFLSKA